MNDKKRLRKARFASIAIMNFMLLPMLVALFVGSVGNRAATIDQATTDYTYSTITGTFTTSNGVLRTVDTEVISTSWGEWTLTAYNGAWICQFWKWGALNVPVAGGTQIWDNHITYWFPNTTYIDSRPFAASWSDWDVIYNGTDAYIAQRYAQVAKAWNPVNDYELNMTSRVTILKYEPIVRLDAWLRNLNATSNITKYSLVGAGKLAAGSETTWTDPINQGLQILTGSSWAIGITGQMINWENSASLNGQFTYGWDQVKYNTSKSIHQRAFLMFGSTAGAVNATYHRIAPMVNNLQEDSVSNKNLLLAYNGDRYDQFGFFGSSWYYTSTALSETVLRNGVYTNRTFLANPIQNYYKLPVVTSMGDIWWSGDSFNESWQNLLALAARYGIALDIRTCLAVPPYEIPAAHDLAVNSTKGYRGGSLFEIVEHSYNHDYALWSNGSLYWNEYWITQGQNAWKSGSLGQTNLTACQTGGGAWANETVEAYARAGFSIISTTLFSGDTHELKIYSSGGHNIYHLAYDNGHSHFGSDPAVFQNVINKAYRAGYYLADGHIDIDFYSAADRAKHELFWSWLQNRSDMISVTMTQLADLLGHEMKYSIVDGLGRLDLSTADAKKNWVILGDGIAEYGLFDRTTGEAVEPTDSDNGITYYVLDAGHIYEERFSHSASMLVKMSVTFLCLGVMLTTVEFGLSIIKQGGAPDASDTRKIVFLVFLIVLSVALIGIAASVLSGG